MEEDWHSQGTMTTVYTSGSNKLKWNFDCNTTIPWINNSPLSTKP